MANIVTPIIKKTAIKLMVVLAKLAKSLLWLEMQTEIRGTITRNGMMQKHQQTLVRNGVIKLRYYTILFFIVRIK